MSRERVARREKRAESDATAHVKVDEAQWEDWRELRDELGRRLGGRDATGVSDPEVLDAARQASARLKARKR